MSASKYILDIICDAAPENGEAQDAVEQAIINGRIRLTESYKADVAQCQQWLERRAIARKRRQLHEACAA